MLVQINTDNNIAGSETLTQHAEAAVREALDHLIEHITRVAVHLSDENSDKKGGTDDMRCMLEARLASHQPIAVSHQAATLEQAIDGAAKKLRHSLDSALGRLGRH